MSTLLVNIFVILSCKSMRWQWRRWDLQGLWRFCTNISWICRNCDSDLSIALHSIS